MLKIYDVDYNFIKGFCVFDYKGLFISGSNKHDTEYVYVCNGWVGSAKIVSPEFNNIADAIAWIDAQDNGRRMMEGSKR